MGAFFFDNLSRSLSATGGVVILEVSRIKSVEILSTYTVAKRLFYIKSLILAQDERWRRVLGMQVEWCRKVTTANGCVTHW